MRGSYVLRMIFRTIFVSGATGFSFTLAATAQTAGLTVLHYDSDFDMIASVTGQKVEWIVPAGSVD